MTRRSTTKMGRLERAPAPKELMRLLVEYESADAFIADAEQHLITGNGMIETQRTIAPDTIIELGVTFPGLLQSLVLDVVVRRADPEGLTVALLDGSATKLIALIEGVRNRDPKIVAPVMTVLIVEDNKHVADLVRQGLIGSTRRDFRHVSFAFETAEDGGMALQLFKQRTFDAAIIDLYLPVLDGASLIQQARKSLGLTIPIITMSGGGDAARNKALRAGSTVFLDKPVRLREMVATMRQLLSV